MPTKVKATRYDEIAFPNLQTDAKVKMAWVDGTQYLSVRDVIVVACQCTINAAGKKWRCISEDHRDELDSLSVDIQFAGSGEHHQQATQFKGLVRLLRCLRGGHARRNRGKVMDTLLPLYSGDRAALRTSWEKSQPRPAIPRVFKALTQKTQEKFRPTVQAPLTFAPFQPFQPQPANTQQHQQHQQQPQTPAEPPSPHDTPGYVYAIASDAFPTVVKIGRASDIPSRLSTINTSMADHEFQLFTCFPTHNPAKDEAEAHRHFAHCRGNREFFAADRNEVLAYFANRNNAFALQKPKHRL